MAATDTLGHIAGSLSDPMLAPTTHAFAITLDNANDLPFVTRQIYVGVAGDIRVTTLGGETVTYPGVAAGYWYGPRVTRVFLTGTTATGLIGEY